MNALSDERSYIRAYRQHANAYVTKPMDLDAYIRSGQGIDAFFLDTAASPPRD